MDTFKVATGDVARIENARGVVLTVEQGAVWLTQAGELQDVFLKAGESCRIERNGVTLLSALRRASFARVTLR